MYRSLIVVVVGILGVTLLCGVSGTWARTDLADASRIFPITAIITFADGSQEVRHGKGFIIGNRLFTVYHTLAPRTNTTPSTQAIYVAGVRMTPVYTHIAHDIAIFELPKALCEPDCNALAPSQLPSLEPNRQVYWVQETGGERRVKEGRVQHVAWLSEAPPAPNPRGEARCQRNLIVEVDTPFRPGTSGSPVFDAATGVIIGMIQGSFARASGDTGYFKPLTCLLPLAQL